MVLACQGFNSLFGNTRHTKLTNYTQNEWYKHDIGNLGRKSKEGIKPEMGPNLKFKE